VVASLPTLPDPRSIERVGNVAVVCHTAVGAVSMKGRGQKAPEVQTGKVSRQKIVQKVSGTGKIKRVHKPPNLAQINACRPWLEAEMELVKPRMIVCLGASAARTVLGPEFRVSRQRGETIRRPGAPWTMATFHPSAIVRMPDRERREEARVLFLKDLRKVAVQMRRLAG